ncbi:uncharacterized protein LOC107424047 isoform X1 [Ziziphus jujuba]|uniref:Uncharacterized protein LOC107424047 isoform X1 n=1 Tax=Ziziphus jujuba TaxID=326968 RepID=A0ABM3IUC8_ZIZJJ|nr:uncharacterized protein LOC107424047 isoform X1 [Ziziphus jujuba]
MLLRPIWQNHRPNPIGHDALPFFLFFSFSLSLSLFYTNACQLIALPIQTPITIASMADSKPQFHSDGEVKAPNLSGTKEEENHRETHGRRKDIDENTTLDAVRAPNVFERAKEEVEAIIQTIHPRKESPISRDEARKEDGKQDKLNSPSENDAKTPKFLDKAKDKIQKIMKHEKSSPRHHKETHGMSNDIDENTPVDEVKGPSVFERAKEEIEAVLETIHPKKEETDSAPPEKREGGFRATIGKGLEKVCSPRSSQRN